MQDEQQQNEGEVDEEVETAPTEVGTSAREPEVAEEIEVSKPTLINKMEAFVDTKLFQGLMLITTIYALIGTDIAAWVGISQEQYKIMHTVSLIALILFFVEWKFYYFLLPFCLSIFGHDERAMALYPTDRKRKRTELVKSPWGWVLHIWVYI